MILRITGRVDSGHCAGPTFLTPSAERAYDELRLLPKGSAMWKRLGAAGRLLLWLSIFGLLAPACWELFSDDDSDAGPSGADATVPGEGLCEPCLLPAQCGEAADLCLVNHDTQERFCSRDCGSRACPAGYACTDVPLGDSVARQCVPETLTCGLEPAECEPSCEAGTRCADGLCLVDGPHLAERAFCVALVNAYRELAGLAPLSPVAELEDCAAQAAEADGETEVPHGWFDTTGGCGVADAETEIPGWPLAQYGSVFTVIDQGTALMWSEGPGGANHDTLLGEHQGIGCGVYVTPDNRVWVVQDFQ
jgi:hypothetical protein